MGIRKQVIAPSTYRRDANAELLCTEPHETGKEVNEQKSDKASLLLRFEVLTKKPT